MNDARRPNGTNRQCGLTLHAMYFVYAVVAVLAIVFGWVVRAVFAWLMAAPWLFAWFDDRRHPTSHIAKPVSDRQLQKSANDTFPDTVKVLLRVIITNKLQRTGYNRQIERQSGSAMAELGRLLSLPSFPVSSRSCAGAIDLERPTNWCRVRTAELWVSGSRW